MFFISSSFGVYNFVKQIVHLKFYYQIKKIIVYSLMKLQMARIRFIT